MPYVPPPDLATLSLAEIAELSAQRKLPPVELWNPQVSGDSLMVIKADGRWFHDGGEIKRPAMIRASAKNHAYVTIVTDPADYPALIEELADGTTSYAFRQRMAAKAYARAVTLANNSGHPDAGLDSASPRMLE